MVILPNFTGHFPQIYKKYQKYFQIPEKSINSRSRKRIFVKFGIIPGAKLMR